MRNAFIHTASVRAAIDSMTALRAQPDGLPCLAAWHGPAGRGKTEASIWYATNKGARYMIPKVASTKREMLCDLYAVLNKRKTAAFHRSQTAYEACLRLMWADNTPLLIDEADRIVSRTELIETIRDLSDRTGCPVIFVGTDNMELRLMQREQVASRLAEVVEFGALTVDEVAMITAELCGLELSPDTAKVLQKRTQGYVRDLVVSLLHLERAARANKLTSPPAEMADDIARRAIKRAA